MSATVLLGAVDQTLAAEMRAVVGEAGDYDVVATEVSSAGVLATLARTATEVVLLHEDFGPLPVLELVRDIAQRHPAVAVMLLVRDGSSATLASAMEAGARSVLSLPLSVEETAARMASAVALSRSLQRALSGDAISQLGGGRLIVLAGAKGGVGTTTLAIHLALLAARTEGGRVCLVDLDLQAGDVAAMFDLTSERGVVDLAEAAEDLSPRAIADACFVHPTGLRLLLAPLEGERGEEVRRSAARSMLGALRSRFDVVVVDAGATMTVASAEAVNLADVALVVVTPDVLALRAARRLTRLWNRLQVRKEPDVTLVVNRASRRSSFQPDTARRFSGTPVARTTIPESPRELEDPTNAGDPGLLVAGQFSRGLARLAAELDLAAAPSAGAAVTPPSRTGEGGAAAVGAVPAERVRRRRGSSGQIAVELIPVLFVLTLAFFAALQGVAYGYGLMLAGHAAERGARHLAVGEPVTRGCATVPSGYGCAIGSLGGDRVKATLRVPRVFPVGPALTIASDAGTVRE